MPWSGPLRGAAVEFGGDGERVGVEFDHRAQGGVELANAVEVGLGGAAGGHPGEIREGDLFEIGGLRGGCAGEGGGRSGAEEKGAAIHRSPC